MKIKSGDKVHVTTGKDKGKQGKVLQVFPELGRIVVDGVNVTIKHLKSRGGQQGQKIEYSAPIHVSNVKLVSEKSGKIGRVGYKQIEKDGSTTKIRVLRSKATTEDIE